MFSDYASVSFFHERSCDSHSLHNYLGFSENSCVSACNQKWHGHSLFTGTQIFLGSDALEDSFFMQDGRDTTLSLVDDRAWINRHPAAVSMFSGLRQPLHLLDFFSHFHHSAFPDHPLCQLKTAQSTLLKTWNHGEETDCSTGLQVWEAWN